MEEVKNKWYTDDNGKISSLRIIVLPGAYIGFATIIAGIVAMFMNLTPAGTAMTVGAGMVATSQGAKAWQKNSERKKDNA